MYQCYPVLGTDTTENLTTSPVYTYQHALTMYNNWTSLLIPAVVFSLEFSELGLAVATFVSLTI